MPRCHLRMRKRRTPGSRKRPCGRRMTRACAVLAMIKPGRERSRKPGPGGDGYLRRTAFSPVKFSHRFTMTSTYLGSYSIVQHLRLSCSQAMRVEPLPPNRSSTVWPGFELFLMSLPQSTTGFMVGCSALRGGLSQRRTLLGVCVSRACALMAQSSSWSFFMCRRSSGFASSMTVVWLRSLMK